MHLPNSSTLSFKPSSRKVASRKFPKSIATILWVIFFLFVFDISINFLFPYPTDPRITSAGQLNTYFEYGRSIEGKLSRMIGATDETSSSLAQAGWLDPQLWQKLDLPVKPAPGKDLLVAIYGMSFSNHVGEAMAKINPQLTIRSIAGPAAPPNYSFAAYNLDRGKHQADVVVLGLLASSVKALRTLNGMTWQFESPAPYTYPRYVIENGKLTAVWPNVRSLSQFRTTFQDKQQWQAFVNQLQECDQFFNPFLFQHNWLDNSAIVRLIRRAWAQRHQSAIANQTHTEKGFEPEDIEVLRAMVADFAATAKSDRKLPIVLILNDKGFNDHLFQALKPTLESASIPYVSTHSIAPATDIKNFIGDGHFTKTANDKIANAVLEVIKKHHSLAAKTAPSKE